MLRKMLPILFGVVALFPLSCYSQLFDGEEDYQSHYNSNNDYYQDRQNDYNSQNAYSNYYYQQEFPQYNSSADNDDYYQQRRHRRAHHQGNISGNFAARLPQTISITEKVIVIDPRVHAWGAYEDGKLIRGGLASAGSSWCRDLGRPCHTSSGSFRIWSLGSSGCISRKFPLGEGGAPMPYCMYFNRTQALHGSYELADGNISHGCVRMHVSDAEWIRYNFAHIGTRVVVRPY